MATPMAMPIAMVVAMATATATTMAMAWPWPQSPCHEWCASHLRGRHHQRHPWTHDFFYISVDSLVGTLGGSSKDASKQSPKESPNGAQKPVKKDFCSTHAPMPTKFPGKPTGYRPTVAYKKFRIATETLQIQLTNERRDITRGLAPHGQTWPANHGLFSLSQKDPHPYGQPAT